MCGVHGEEGREWEQGSHCYMHIYPVNGIPIPRNFSLCRRANTSNPGVRGEAHCALSGMGPRLGGHTDAIHLSAVFSPAKEVLG